MSHKLTAADRSVLIKLASSLEVGSAERKTILAGLSPVTQAKVLFTLRGIGLVPVTINDNGRMKPAPDRKMGFGGGTADSRQQNKKVEDRVISELEALGAQIDRIGKGFTAKFDLGFGYSFEWNLYGNKDSKTYWLVLSVL